MTNAQQWLDTNYPLATRNQITKLDLSSKNLEGELDLNDFINLKELKCFFNQLTSLNLTNCSQLSSLDCAFNQLTQLFLPANVNLQELVTTVNSLTNSDFLDSLSDQLTYLHLGNNVLPTNDCRCLAKFVQLTDLRIGTGTTNTSGTIDVESLNQGLYNRWIGSLESLRNLTQLKWLGISNTDIDRGLEYLPAGLEKLWCDNTMTNAKCRRLVQQLRNYTKKDHYGRTYYDYPAWREANLESINKILELESSLDNLNLALDKQELNQTADHAFQIFIRETENQITELRKNLYQEEQLENRIEVISLK